MPTLEESEADGAMRYVLKGRLDSPGVQEIEGKLNERVQRATKNVVLDLRQVPFVGSLGIRLLISAARTVQKQGRALVLVGVQPQVSDVFDTIALGDMIPIATDDAEAATLLTK